MIAAAFAAEPFAGNWKLSPANSSGAIPTDETITIQIRRGILTFDIRITPSVASQAPIRIRFSVPAKGGTAKLTEGPFDEVDLIRQDNRRLAIAYFVQGKPVRSTQVIVSADGKSMASTGAAAGSQSNWTMVFQRQAPPPR